MSAGELGPLFEQRTGHDPAGVDVPAPPTIRPDGGADPLQRVQELHARAVRLETKLARCLEAVGALRASWGLQ